MAHLDLMRTWERAIRRARLPLTYSQGFTPHPKLQLAAPLPVGTAAEREYIDVWLDEELVPSEVAERLGVQLPGGLGIVDVREVDERSPSLQSDSTAARYEVRYALGEVDMAAAREAIERFMALETLPWVEERGERTRSFDLRPAVLDLALREDAGEALLAMRLSLRDGGSARPSSVASALGLADLEPLLTTRAAIELASDQEAPVQVEV